jgi:hypothetical protein
MRRPVAEDRACLACHINRGSNTSKPWNLCGLFNPLKWTRLLTAMVFWDAYGASRARWPVRRFDALIQMGGWYTNVTPNKKRRQRGTKSNVLGKTDMHSVESVRGRPTATALTCGRCRACGKRPVIPIKSSLFPNSLRTVWRAFTAVPWKALARFPQAPTGSSCRSISLDQVKDRKRKRTFLSGGDGKRADSGDFGHEISSRHSGQQWSCVSHTSFMSPI